MSIKSLVFAVLIVVLLSAPVFAEENTSVNASANAFSNVTTPSPTPKPVSPLERAVKLYVSEGENREIINVSTSEGTYTLVKVGGRESLILDRNYRVVADPAQVSVVAAAYVSSLSIPFSQSNVDSLKSSFFTLNVSLVNCTRFYYEFRSNIRVCYEDVLRKFLCSTVYDADFSAALNLSFRITPYRHMINNGTAQMNESLRGLASGVNAVEASFASGDRGGITNALNTMRSIADNFSAGHTLFLEGHNKILTYRPFAFEGGLNRCAISINSLNQMKEVIALAAQFPNETAVSASVLAFTTGRANTAAVNDYYEEVVGNLTQFQDEFNEFKTKYVNVTSQQPKGMQASFDKLQALAQAVRSAQNASTAQNAVVAFYVQLNISATLLSSQSSALPELASALSAREEAQKNIAEASTRLGAEDGRVTQMQKEFASLQSTIELKQADLAAGRTASAAEFSNLSREMSVLAANARSTVPPQNQLDIVLIVGVVILLAALAGVVFFLRNFKMRMQDGNQKEARSEDLSKK